MYGNDNDNYLKDSYTDEEFFSENNPCPEGDDTYHVDNIYYEKDEDGIWRKIDGYWDDGLFHRDEEDD